MKIIGIDPGFDGAIAALDTDSGTLEIFDFPIVEFKKNGKNVREYAESELRDIIQAEAGNFAAIELQTPRLNAAKSVNGETGFFNVSATAKQMMGYGMMKGILIGLRVPYVAVPPATWKKSYNLSADKGAARAEAGRLMPSCAGYWAPRIGRADRAEAALIAYWLAKENNILPVNIEPRSAPKRRTS